ncbi:hypothetical protein M3Y99_01210300 [Aphelenchoides fujianensis]|nr:hypothetical protein M3Y99_01210300 [Aphelenchoides fujianensis]
MDGSADGCRLDLVDEIYLEDFGVLDRVPSLRAAKAGVASIRLGISFVHSTDSSFYSKAVDRLLEATLHLCSVELEGGYIYRPNEETADELRAEVRRLRDHLEQLAALFAARRLPLRRLHFSAVFCFDQQAAKEAELPELLSELFGFPKDAPLKRDILDFLYVTKAGVVASVRLSPTVHFLREFVPFGRSRFHDRPDSLKRILCFDHDENKVTS